MSLIPLTIPGPPVPWGRARPSNRTGRPITPKRYRRWKEAAREELAVRWRGAPLDGPVSLSVSAYWPRPKRMSRGAREPRIGREDADNVAKAVMDAGNGILYGDDRQVVELQARKWYAASGEAPRIEIVVGAWGEVSGA